MWRSVSVLLVVVAIAPSSLRAADKREAPAETQARDLVKQALLAESQGDNDQRSKYLKEAWLSVPDLAEANWHMARIRVGDEWQPLAEAVSAAQSPDEATYRQLREKANKPRQLRELARWCDKHGWSDRAHLHYAQLLADPKAEASYKSEAVEELDLVQVNGQWLTSQEIKARKEELQAIQDSLAKWRPKLKALQQIIDGPDFAKRDKAIQELLKLDDPTVIPTLESFLLDGGADFQEQAVKRLASFPDYEATEALVRFAVLPEPVVVRDSAIEALKRRSLTEYGTLLISALRSPIDSRFSLATDKHGSIKYVHVLARETQDEYQVIGLSAMRVAATWHSRSNTIQPAHKTLNPPILGVVDSQRNLAAIQAANVEFQVRQYNAGTNQRNHRLWHALEGTTGEKLPRNPHSWWEWWQDYNEYTWPKPTKRAFKSHADFYIRSVGMSCFVAGTTVRTERGPVPIESIQPGDRVLAQDQDTGELTYKVVLKTTLRPPAKMLRITARNDEVVTTLGHPFWVSGHGWKMAKELKAGDLLHTLGGAVKIESIQPAGEERAYNLVVDDFNTYFVGQAGCLVHDNEFRKPTQATVPGLVD